MVVRDASKFISSFIAIEKIVAEIRRVKPELSDDEAFEFAKGLIEKLEKEAVLRR